MNLIKAFAAEFKEIKAPSAKEVFATGAWTFAVSAAVSLVITGIDSLFYTVINFFRGLPGMLSESGDAAASGDASGSATASGDASGNAQ